MDGELFGLCGYVATGGDDDEGVCLAVRVLEVEPTEEDRRRCGDALAESHPLAYACYY